MSIDPPTCLFIYTCIFLSLLWQYVERRFKSKCLRQATAVLQLVGGYLFIGFLLFPPSVALQRMIGLSFFLNIVIIGVSCTLYSTFVSSRTNVITFITTLHNEITLATMLPLKSVSEVMIYIGVLSRLGTSSRN